MNVGFVGLGMMGSPIASHLQSAGYHLSVYNRTKEKAQPLLKRGAVWCDSPKAVAEKSECVFSMISNSEVLEKCASGADGVFHGLPADGIHVDMSTVSPETTQKLAALYESNGKHFLHSPVLGSVPQAAEGSLLIFVGGPEHLIARVEPMLKILGSRVWHFERAELASYTKLLCNTFIAGMMNTLAQSLVMGVKAGIAPSTLLEIIGHSSMNASMYQSKGKTIIARQFTPRFIVEHMLKDVNLILDAGKKLNVPLEGTEAAQRVFSEAVSLGFGKEDYSAMIKAIERHAGVVVK
jgi:3-hydroxyisobutyrate dehydrogenase-like beta-hydroxyacid dehydrogenase